MKPFEEMTTQDWCRLYATMNMLLEQGVITFDLDRAYFEFHADAAMSYLENQNVDLQRQIEEKDEIIKKQKDNIDMAIRYINRVYIQIREKVSFSMKDTLQGKRLLEILERGKNEKRD